MSDNDFEQTPLFQLNLMLWLAWYPLKYETSGIRPIFREAGFDLQGIGPSIIMPLAMEARAKVAGLRINRTATPDLLLKNTCRNLLLPIECKLNSFGPDRKESKQAYVLLSASGPQLARSFGLMEPEEWISHVMYAVSGDGDARAQMINTLRSLAANLDKATIPNNPSGSLGILIDADHVYLQQQFSF